jgi:acyl-CoA synthetase (AMP-forming)/AMP-acid ligase II
MIAKLVGYSYLKHIRRLILPKDLIRFGISRNRNKIAFPEENITYEVLYENSKRLANALLEIGLRKGEKIAFFSKNCREYFEVRIATYLSGIVPVPLIWDLKIEGLIKILNECSVKAIIYQNELLEDKIDYLKEKTFVEFFIPLKGNEEKSYNSLISNTSSKEPNIKININDIASINLSSATTGSAKKIVTLQKNWSASFYNYFLNSDFSPEDIIALHVIPFTTAGSTTIIPAIISGVQNIILDEFEPEKVVWLIDKFKVNTIFLTPGWLNLLLEFCQKKGKRLKSLKKIIVGTDRIQKQKFKEAIDFFSPIIEQGYGMAEALPPIAFLKPKDYFKEGKLIEGRLLSIGKPVKNVKVKIESHSNEVKKGEFGEIVIKSETVTKGYYNDEGLTQKHFKNGWFYSKDFGYKDEDGFIYLMAREEEIIEGEKIGIIRKLEELLNESLSIKEGAVLNIENKKIAFVSLKSNLDNEIRKMFDDLVILEEIPKNACGKIDRKGLQRLLK